jgi:hypothetical protein
MCRSARPPLGAVVVELYNQLQLIPADQARHSSGRGLRTNDKRRQVQTQNRSIRITDHRALEQVDTGPVMNSAAPLLGRISPLETRFLWASFDS